MEEKKSLYNKIEDIKMPIRLTIFFGTIVVFIVLFIWLVYLPKTASIKTALTNVEDVNSQLSRAKIQRQKLPKVRAEKEKVDLQFDAAQKLLPSDREIPELLTKITELGTESNLDMSTFVPQSLRNKGFYAEIPISLQITGNYHDVAVFFEKIGKMDRIMNIQNVRMTPVSNLSTTLNITCNAITYTFIQTKQGK
ncbi:type 4a pilus biogenesis protein PilO [Thermodesulfobacteriota bacterium]